MYEDYKSIEKFVKENLDFEDTARQMVRRAYEDLLALVKESNKFKQKRNAR